MPVSAIGAASTLDAPGAERSSRRHSQDLPSQLFHSWNERWQMLADNSIYFIDPTILNNSSETFG